MKTTTKERIEQAMEDALQDVDAGFCVAHRAAQRGSRTEGIDEHRPPVARRQ